MKTAWLAETVNQTHQYAEPAQAGSPTGLTSDPWKARRFATRHEAHMFVTGNYARASLPPLRPVEHAFTEDAQPALVALDVAGAAWPTPWSQQRLDVSDPDYEKNDEILDADGCPILSGARELLSLIIDATNNRAFLTAMHCAAREELAAERAFKNQCLNIMELATREHVHTKARLYECAETLTDLSETWNRFIGHEDTPGTDDLDDLMRIVVRGRRVLAKVQASR